MSTTDSGITCPLCGQSTRVIATRRQDAMLRRRRECLACRFRITTIEHILFPARFRPPDGPDRPV